MKLKDWLIKEGLSVTDFARRLGKPQPTVARYVSGDRMPEPPIMRQIRDLTNFEVKADDFYDATPVLAPDVDSTKAPGEVGT